LLRSGGVTGEGNILFKSQTGPVFTTPALLVRKTEQKVKTLRESAIILCHPVQTTSDK
jgi:hypothetical protein